MKVFVRPSAPLFFVTQTFRFSLVFFVLTFVPQIQAANDTWTGAANGDWINSGNWSVGSVPGTTGGASGANADIATFNNSVNTTIAIDMDRNIRSILFDTASVGSFTFNSITPLFLTSGGTTAISSTGTGTQTFNAPIVIGNGGGSTYSLAVLAANSATNTRLNFTGNITSMGNSGTTTLTLQSANQGLVGGFNTNWQYSTISGVISDSVAGAATGITKTGRGGWELTGVNTYSGPTVINGGYLLANDGVGLSSNSNLLIQSTTAGESAMLQVSNNFTRSLGTGAGQVQILNSTGGGSGAGIGVSFLGNVVVAFGGTAAPEQITWGSANFNPNAFVLGGPTNSPPFSTVANSALDFRNPIALGGSGTTRIFQIGNNTIPRNLFVTLSGELSGDANFQMAGRGVLILPSVHTYTGTSTFSSGEVRVMSFNSVETNVGLGTVHSSSSSLGAPTTAAAGTIYVASAGSGFTVRYQGSGETTDRAMVINAGQTFSLINDGTGDLTFINGIGRQAATNPILVLGGTSTFNGEIKGNIDLGSLAVTSTQVTKNGSNLWVLSGNNSWTGVTAINGATGNILRADDGGGLPEASNVRFESSGGIWETGAEITRSIGTGAGQITQVVGTAAGFSAFGGSVVVALGGASTPTALTWGSTTFNPVQTFALNSTLANNTLEFRNAVNLNSGGSSVTRTVSVGANRATMTGNLTQSGAGAAALTKTGAGTLVLSGVNSYLGVTTVSAGTLLINGDNSGATGNVTVASGATLGGTGTVGGASTLTNISAGGRLSPGASPGELTFSGNLTLSGASFVDFEAGDLVDVDGSLTLSTTWTLALGTGFMDGGSVTIFEYGTATLPAGALDAARINAGSLGFTPTGPLTFTDTGSTIELNGISAIPEPGTSILAALGFGLLLYARCQKRRESF